jgi:DNA-binding response OmpR family regulator
MSLAPLSKDLWFEVGQTSGPLEVHADAGSADVELVALIVRDSNGNMIITTRSHERLSDEEFESIVGRVDLRLHDQPDGGTSPSGGLCIDFDKERVSRNGHYVHLSGKEWEVLATLAKSPGELISQARVLEEVWGPECRHRREYLPPIMMSLRKKLEDNPTKPRHLITIRGRGLRFEP